MSKIKEEQLKELQGLVAAIQQGQSQIGGLELQKSDLFAQVKDVQVKLSEFQKELETEYGQVSISIEDGSIKEIEKEDDKD
tara:strand:+ start:496 stop:738 length:243 start_codon:yes stop_codon:yes gene_type:complete